MWSLGINWNEKREGQIRARKSDDAWFGDTIENGVHFHLRYSVLNFVVYRTNLDTNWLVYKNNPFNSRLGGL